MTIWKFDVPIADEFTVLMPAGARVLSVDWQQGKAKMWAIVDPAAPLAPRTFAVRGTGHVLGFDAWNFIGTFQMADGALIWHLFEVL